MKNHIIFAIVFVLTFSSVFSQIVIEDRTKPIEQGRLFDSNKKFPLMGSQVSAFTVFDSLTILGIDRGRGWIQKSTDAGITWNTVYKNPPPPIENINGADLIRMIKLTKDKFIVVGGTGRIIRTTDIGNTWTVDSTGFTTPLQYIDNADSLNIVIGRLPDGSLLHSSDGGEEWNTLTFPDGMIPSNYGIIGLLYLEKNTIIVHYAFKEDRIQLRTSDLGKTWDKTDITTLRLQPGKLFKYNKDTLFAIQLVGINDNPNDPRTKDILLRSIDAGNSWHYLINGIYTPTAGVSEITMFSKNFGILLGDLGKAYSTIDGGESWLREQSPLQQTVETKKAGYAKPYFINRNLVYTRFVDTFLHVRLYDKPQLLSGTNGDYFEKEVSLSPNPVTDLVSLKSDILDGLITITNSMGEIVKNIKHEQYQTLIDTQDLISGVYNIQIRKNDKFQKGKFIIIR